MLAHSQRSRAWHFKPLAEENSGHRSDGESEKSSAVHARCGRQLLRGLGAGSRLGRRSYRDVSYERRNFSDSVLTLRRLRSGLAGRASICRVRDLLASGVGSLRLSARDRRRARRHRGSGGDWLLGRRCDADVLGHCAIHRGARYLHRRGAWCGSRARCGCRALRWCGLALCRSSVRGRSGRLALIMR